MIAATQADLTVRPAASSGLRRWGAGPGRAAGRHEDDVRRTVRSPVRQRGGRCRTGPDQQIEGADSDRDQLASEERFRPLALAASWPRAFQPLCRATRLQVPL